LLSLLLLLMLLFAPTSSSVQTAAETELSRAYAMTEADGSKPRTTQPAGCAVFAGGRRAERYRGVAVSMRRRVSTVESTMALRTVLVASDALAAAVLAGRGGVRGGEDARAVAGESTGDIVADTGADSGADEVGCCCCCVRNKGRRDGNDRRRSVAEG
jgi:hypothetical protein